MAGCLFKIQSILFISEEMRECPDHGPDNLENNHNLKNNDNLKNNPHLNFALIALEFNEIFIVTL